MDGQQRVPAIVLTGKHGAEFVALNLCFDRFRFPFKLLSQAFIVEPGKLERVRGSLVEFLPEFNIISQRGDFFHHTLGMFRVLPEFRFFRLFLEFFELGFLLGEVKDAPGAYGFFPGFQLTAQLDLAWS
jgi:hypothetical protein